MSVHAITPIQHGNTDGSITNFAVGDELDDSFSDDELQAFILGGSAVEIGKKRKFTSPAGAVAGTDEETQKRDELIAKSLLSDEPSPAAVAGASAVQDEVEKQKK